MLAAMTTCPPDETAARDMAGPAEPGGEDRLAAALLDSRRRWRDLALLSADLLFETDAAGRFAFLAPDPVLGHPAAALLGRRAAELLAEQAGPDPFDAAAPARGLRAWVRPAEGAPLCLEFTAMRVAGGLRGAARDVTAEERQEDAAARALRHATALGRLLAAAQRGRGEGAAGAAVLAILAGLGPALGCAGAALLGARDGRWRIEAEAGEDAAPWLLLLPAAPGPGGATRLATGGLLLPVGSDLFLLAWRDPALEEEEIAVLSALAAPVAALQAEAARQRELDRAARTDALTGLLNRRGLLDALAARLARPGAAGVLAYLDADGLKPINDRLGHEAGDAALRHLAGRLRAIAGPQDLAGRLGGDEFALWLDGATEAEAALRCAPIGVALPVPGWPAEAARIAASLGLATPAPGETAEQLTARADASMYRAKRERRAA